MDYRYKLANSFVKLSEETKKMMESPDFPKEKTVEYMQMSRTFLTKASEITNKIIEENTIIIDGITYTLNQAVNDIQIELNKIETINRRITIGVKIFEILEEFENITKKCLKYALAA